MTTLTNKEIIKSFFNAVKEAFLDGSKWPSGNSFTVYRYENMRDHRTEPPRPFVFIGARGTGDEPTWQPCVIINAITKKVNAELGQKATLLNVTLDVITRSGGEEESIITVLQDALETVVFTSEDGDYEFPVDVENEWEIIQNEVPAAVAAEGSLRNWRTMVASFLIF